jgi:hypothetical protein
MRPQPRPSPKATKPVKQRPIDEEEPEEDELEQEESPHESPGKKAPRKDAETQYSGSIVETDSWMNRKGKAIYVSVMEADCEFDDNGRMTFITSVSNLERFASGEIKGVKLGKFEE